MRESTFYPLQREPMPDSCWSLSAGPDGRIFGLCGGDNDIAHLNGSAA